MNNNYDFPGAVPDGASVEGDIRRALEYQETHTLSETYAWFYEYAKNNSEKRQDRLPLNPLDPNHSMDYKQIDPIYLDYSQSSFHHGFCPLEQIYDKMRHTQYV